MDHEAEFEALAAELETPGRCPGFELRCNVVYDAGMSRWVILIHSFNIKKPYSLEVPDLGLSEPWFDGKYWYEAGGAGGMIGWVGRRTDK